MSLTIQQAIPQGVNDALTMTGSIIKSVDVASTAVSNINSIVDECTGFSLSGMVDTSGLSDMLDTSNLLGLLDPMDKLLGNMLNIDLPEITLGKLELTALKGLTSGFECAYKNLANPINKSLSFMDNYDKLTNINCQDSSANTDTPTSRHNALKAAAGMVNCSKNDLDAITSIVADITTLDPLNIETADITKTLLSTVVSDKFDLNVSSSLLDDVSLKSFLPELIALDEKPISSIFKIDNSAKLLPDKSSMLNFGVDLSTPYTMAIETSPKIQEISRLATMDSNLSMPSLPKVGSLGIGQKLHSINIASKITKPPSFGSLKSMIA